MFRKVNFRRGFPAVSIATESQFAFSALAAALLLVSTSAHAGTTTSRARYLMGTICTITVPSQQDLPHVERAFAEITRIENAISTWRPDSELSRLNVLPVGDTMQLSSEVGDLLARVITASRETNGAFNPLVRPLVDAWRTREAGAVPPAGALRAALARMNVDDLSLDNAHDTASRGADVLVEEGAFGKGYALDRAADVLAHAGVRDATLDFGGQLVVRGRRRVSISSPLARETAALTLVLRDASLSTSSGSEKQFLIDGKRFSHIFDPRTGEALPPRGSVSVISSDAFDADVLSTALYVMGPVEGLAYANAHDVAAIFIAPSGESAFDVRLTQSLRKLAIDLEMVDAHFTLKEEE